MVYKITFKRSAEKELVKLPSKVIRQIVPAIDNLAADPRPPGCKKLEGSKENLWRIRIGSYRIIIVSKMLSGLSR